MRYKKVIAVFCLIGVFLTSFFVVFGKINSIEGTWIESNNSLYGTLKEGKVFFRGSEVGYYEKVADHEWIVYLNAMHKQNPRNPIEKHFITASYFSISTGPREQPLYRKETTNKLLMEYIYGPLGL